MNPRSATILKILNGSASHERGVMRDDASVRPAGAPVEFPWFDLNEKERAMFRHLIECGALPAIHARADSFMFAAAAKLAVQLMEAQAKVREYGMVMKDPGGGKPVVQPYFAAYMDLQRQVNRLFNELGLTPTGRLRHAPPAQGQISIPTAWDEIE